MFRQDVNIIASAIDLHWDLPDPVTLTDSLTRGVTADVWLVETAPAPATSPSSPTQAKLSSKPVCRSRSTSNVVPDCLPDVRSGIVPAG